MAMSWRSLSLMLLLVSPSAAWNLDLKRAGGRLQIEGCAASSQLELTRARSRAISQARLCEDSEHVSLQAELKRAAAARLGVSLELLLRPEDVEASRVNADTMAQALLKSRQWLERRKAEIGEEAAIAELDASIRNGSE
mmetsp:Transcript_66525/g.110613  ORF Transcript_66525/g.110613 Transcript_66525/m.110613 type:complete len:139 (-) Transcript_66525:415-831(-)